MKKYKKFMDGAFAPYYTDEVFTENYGRVPKFRYDTFKYCWDSVKKNDFRTIVELGTSRSFVDGQYPGCNEDNPSYWEPDNPKVWDWSAGCFTRVFGELIQDTEIELMSVDMMWNHIERSKLMTKGLKNIEHFVCSSEEFLDVGEGQIDLLYMDTGDVTPIEPTAELHLRESKILVEKNLIRIGGLILIDDVRNPQSMKQNDDEYGKAKYSIPYLRDNGFEIIMDEYQVLMQKVV
jgi:hypothetical protein